MTYRQTEENAAAQTRTDWALTEETREREAAVHERRRSLRESVAKWLGRSK